MFNELINLYKRGSSKTPLEDFTTEAFVGILKLEPEIKQAFISDFLKLPESDYVLKTQVRYDLPNDPNCIIDFVLEGDDSICFIENKVNSKEGYKQLKRYSEVLDGFADNDWKTKLFYCTKFHDPKEIIAHGFESIRWFQIGKFLTKFSDNNTVNNFLTFLKKHKMSQELTITAQDFITFDNLQKTISLVNEHLDRVKPIFQDKFGQKCKISNGRTTAQILTHNRLVYYIENISDTPGYSDMVYGFRFDTPKITVSLYMSKTNESHKLFLEEMEKHKEGFDLSKDEDGSIVYIEKDISVFLNMVDGDSEIAEWFTETFEAFHKLMLATPSLNWKI